MIDQCPSERRRVCVWRHAEGFVLGERKVLEPNLDGFSEVSCRTAARAIAQNGAAVRPRAQLLTWRGV